MTPTRGKTPEAWRSASGGTPGSGDEHEVLVSGWRTTRRSSKLGKRLRREARMRRMKERARSAIRGAGATAASAVAGVLKGIGVLLVVALALFVIATGVNAAARYLARKEAERAGGSAARAEQARENLLIIGESPEGGAEFLAVRLDEKDRQVLGIAVPGGAFMEVPGQGFERVGDSYAAGPEVSLAAVSNFLSVPFERYVVVDAQVYKDALAAQSLRDLIGQVKTGNLAPGELDEVARFIEGVSADRTALVPLPVRPIDLGGQTFFEPQKDRIADLLLQWWGVRVGERDAAVRVMVYNGVGTPGIAGIAAQQLISAGLKVVETRNADRFDYAETLIVVQDGDVKQGERVRDVLGVGRVLDQPSAQDVADVIVIIGKDYLPPATDAR